MQPCTHRGARVILYVGDADTLHTELNYGGGGKKWSGSNKLRLNV